MTILLLRRSDSVVELGPISSYVEIGCVDAEREEETKRFGCAF